MEGNLLGGADTVLEMNETGKLKEVLKGFEVQPAAGCQGCGGAGYITCGWCQGSGKSLKNPFAGKQGHDVGLTDVLKCTVCNANGLQRCPVC
jgi:glutaredoxin domain-containing cysteine-rich protein 1